MFASNPSNPAGDGLLRLAGHIWRGIGARAADFTTLERAAGVVVSCVLDKTPRRRILGYTDTPDIRTTVEQERRWLAARAPLEGVLLSHWAILLEPDVARRRAIIADLAREFGQPNRDAVLADCARLQRGW